MNVTDDRRQMTDRQTTDGRPVPYSERQNRIEVDLLLKRQLTDN